MSDEQPPAEELEKRVAYLRHLQERDQLPAADLYWCRCGVWTLAVHLTPDIRCECGDVPAYQVTISPSTTDNGLEGAGEKTPTPVAAPVHPGLKASREEAERTRG